MKETLHNIICEAIQEGECAWYCNYPPCNKVQQLAEALIKNGVIVPPCKIGDAVYYIGGIHNTLVKAAKVNEICFNGDAFSLGLISENNIYFDMQADEVFFTKNSAEEAIR